MIDAGLLTGWFHLSSPNSCCQVVGVSTRETAHSASDMVSAISSGLPNLFILLPLNSPVASHPHLMLELEKA